MMGLNMSSGDIDATQRSVNQTVNVGLTTYVVFAILFNILLMNLLIARIRGSHDRIDAKSKSLWGHMMVRASVRLFQLCCSLQLSAKHYLDGATYF